MWCNSSEGLRKTIQYLIQQYSNETATRSKLKIHHYSHTPSLRYNTFRAKCVRHAHPAIDGGGQSGGGHAGLSLCGGRDGVLGGPTWVDGAGAQASRPAPRVSMAAAPANEATSA